MNRQSKWYKEIGGDRGAVKIGTTWYGYVCLTCAQERYPELFKTDRWQGPPSKAIIQAMKSFSLWCNKQHYIIETHNT